MANTKEKKPSFEASMSRLEALIEAMESGDMPLSELMDHYEEGGKLLRECQAELQKATLRVEKIVGEQENLELEPFSEDR